jgi:adenine/guanine phosphoribosyltransferase-like PRPP-binding protein
MSMSKQLPDLSGFRGSEVVRSHASYLQPIIEDADRMVQNFRAKMRTVDFDTVVGTGISGTLAAQLFARALGIHFAIVRKEDGSHSNNKVEGNVGKRWVFVDDLVCSGETRTRVRESMKQFCLDHHFESEYVGDYMYYSNTFRDRTNGNSEES